MKQYYKIFLILFSFQFDSSKGHYRWCGSMDTFCLFSQSSVSDLSEAQLKCSEIKNDSWPVELGDERVKEVFIEFISNYSISDVILNAFIRNGIWYWKNTNISLKDDPNIIPKDNVVLYNSSEHRTNYSVVCLTGCYGKWTEISQHGMDDSKATGHASLGTSEKCKALCETDVTCSSVDWTYGRKFHGCWIHKYPYEGSKLHLKKETSHFVLDRSAKSIDTCISEGFKFAGPLVSSLPIIAATIFSLSVTLSLLPMCLLP